MREKGGGRRREEGGGGRAERGKREEWFTVFSGAV